MTENTTDRIVIVHGAPGPELIEVLHCAGLELVVEGDQVAIWAPALAIAIAPSPHSERPVYDLQEHEVLSRLDHFR